jgi:hypothetical protein
MNGKKPHALESIRRHLTFFFAKGCATAHKEDAASSSPFALPPLYHDGF